MKKREIGYVTKSNNEVSWFVRSAKGGGFIDELSLDILACALDHLLGNRKVVLDVDDVSGVADYKKFPKALKRRGPDSRGFRSRIKWGEFTPEQKIELLNGTDAEFFPDEKSAEDREKMIADVYENNMAVFYEDKNRVVGILKKVADKFDAELVEEKV